MLENDDKLKIEILKVLHGSTHAEAVRLLNETVKVIEKIAMGRELNTN